MVIVAYWLAFEIGVLITSSGKFAGSSITYRDVPSGVTIHGPAIVIAVAVLSAILYRYPRPVPAMIRTIRPASSCGARPSPAFSSEFIQRASVIVSPATTGKLNITSTSPAATPNAAGSGLVPAIVNVSAVFEATPKFSTPTGDSSSFASTVQSYPTQSFPPQPAPAIVSVRVPTAPTPVSAAPKTPSCSRIEGLAISRSNSVSGCPHSASGIAVTSIHAGHGPAPANPASFTDVNRPAERPTNTKYPLPAGSQNVTGTVIVLVFPVCATVTWHGRDTGPGRPSASMRATAIKSTRPAPATGAPGTEPPAAAVSPCAASTGGSKLAGSFTGILPVTRTMGCAVPSFATSYVSCSPKVQSVGP